MFRRGRAGHSRAGQATAGQGRPQQDHIRTVGRAEGREEGQVKNAGWGTMHGQTDYKASSFRQTIMDVATPKPGYTTLQRLSVLTQVMDQARCSESTLPESYILLQNSQHSMDRKPLGTESFWQGIWQGRAGQGKTGQGRAGQDCWSYSAVSFWPVPLLLASSSRGRILFSAGLVCCMGITRYRHTHGKTCHQGSL